MGIRETLNENPAIVLRSTMVVTVIALIFIVWYVFPTRQRAIVPREFFTDDDGETWFPDNSSLIAPFDHNGKQAVLAKVFRCHNGQKFVGYLEKFSDAAKARILEARTTGHMKAGAGAVEQGIDGGDVLVKKPHAPQWVSSRDPKAIEVETFQCPDGRTDYEVALP